MRALSHIPNDSTRRTASRDVSVNPKRFHSRGRFSVRPSSVDPRKDYHHRSCSSNHDEEIIVDKRYSVIRLGEPELHKTPLPPKARRSPPQEKRKRRASSSSDDGAGGGGTGNHQPTAKRPKQTLENTTTNDHNIIQQAPYLRQGQRSAVAAIAAADSPYADVFATVMATAEAEETVAREKCVPMQFWQQACRWTDPAYLATQSNAGDAREAAIRHSLDEFHDPASGRLLERSDTQRSFHTHMLNASAKSIYGRDFAVSASRILERNQWTEFRQEVCIITARGEGKTWSVAMYAAALLINQPMVSIVIFSVAKRQTIQMITLIKQMLASHPIGREMLKGRQAAEHLDLQGSGGPTDRRTVVGLPGRSDTTRGIHAQYVLIDEAAFLSYMLFMETILPTLTKGHTCLIAISTPQGEDNVYTWLTELKDSARGGQSMFNVVRTSRVCDACVAADKAMTCTHLRSKLPPWQEMSKVARMAQLYENDPHLHMREIMGRSADAGTKAFLADDVNRFFASKVRIDNAADVRAVYISADPSGGGTSELAVVAMVEDVHGKLAVCLVASGAGFRGVQDHKIFVDKIWSSIRRRYGQCQIVFMPESNLGNEASHLEQYVKDEPFTVTMREERRGGDWFGVRKSKITTLEMHGYMTHAMARNAIGVTADCVGIPTIAEEKRYSMLAGSEAANKYMLNKLRTQMLAFHWEKIGRASSKDIRYHLTGKSSNENDDLCIGIIMLPYWRQVFIRSFSEHYERAKVHMRLLDPRTKQPLYSYQL